MADPEVQEPRPEDPEDPRDPEGDGRDEEGGEGELRAYMAQMGLTARVLGREFGTIRSRFGTGTALYFAQLRLVFVLLLLMTAIAGVSMHYYYYAGGDERGWFRPSLGNASFDEQLPFLQVGLPDLLYVFLFGLGLVIVERRVVAMQRSLRHEKPSLRTFTVWLRGLPFADLSTAEVAEFCSVFGAVVHVSLPLNAQPVFRSQRAVRHAQAQLAQQRVFDEARPHVGELRALWMRPSSVLLPVPATWPRLRAAAQRLGCGRDKQYWEDRLRRVEQAEEESRTREYGSTGTCFVTFETEAAAIACVSRLRLSVAGEFARRALRRVRLLRPCLDWVGPKGFRGGAYTLRAEAAPEPENVLWSNLAYRRRGRSARNVAAYFVSAGLVAGGMALSLVLNAVALGQDSTVDSLSHEVESSDSHRVSVFALSLLLLVIDRGLVVLMQRCARFERHLTLSGQRASFLRKLSFMRFSSIAVTTVWGYHPWVVERWFGAARGGDAVMSILFWNQLVFPVIRSLLTPALAEARKRVRASRLLQEAPRPRTLDLAKRYSLMYATVGTALMYSSFLPLALPIAAVSILLQYAVDMHLLLHVLAPPPRFDGKLARVASKTLVPLLVLHCFMAILAYQRAYRTDSDAAFRDDYYADSDGTLGTTYATALVMLVACSAAVGALVARALVGPFLSRMLRTVMLPLRCAAHLVRRCRPLYWLCCCCLCCWGRPGGAPRAQLTPAGTTINSFPDVAGRRYEPPGCPEEVRVVSSSPQAERGL